MTEDRRSRMPVIALGSAVLAVTVSLGAAFVVLARDDAQVSAAAPAVALLSDQRVAADDVVKLRNQLEVVVEAGLPRGVRVKDAALAKALGLQEDDVITSLSGRAVTSESDVSHVTYRAGRLGATVIYVELDRGTVHSLMRWQLDGDLLDARQNAVMASRAKASSSIGAFGTGPAGSLGSLGSLVSPPVSPLAPGSTLVNPFADPLLDAIEKVDETNYRVPRATFEAMLADTAMLARGARIIRSNKSGKPDGYRLHAIRPSSAFARLGFDNGDTVHSINGEEVAEIDDLVSWFVNARRATAFRFELTRRGKPVTLRITITK